MTSALTLTDVWSLAKTAGYGMWRLDGGDWPHIAPRRAPIKRERIPIF